MLERIFNYDNVVFRTIGKIGYIWWLNILWVIFSLPVVTIGASTTALLYSCMKLHKNEGYCTKNFIKSFKENFKQSTILYFLFVIVGVLLGVDLIYWNQTGGVMGKTVWGLTIAVLIPYCLILLYVFAVQARFVNPIKRTIQYSFVLSIKNFVWTFQMLLIMGVFIYLNLTWLLANFISLSLGVGVVAYFMCAYYNRIFNPYIEAAMQTAEEENGEAENGESGSEENKQEKTENGETL